MWHLDNHFKLLKAQSKAIGGRSYFYPLFENKLFTLEHCYELLAPYWDLLVYVPNANL